MGIDHLYDKTTQNPDIMWCGVWLVTLQFTFLSDGDEYENINKPWIDSSMHGFLKN